MAISRFMLGAMLLAGVMLQAGCSGGYLLRGKVVEGDIGSIGFVQADDPRLEEPGVGGVKIVIHRDGDKPWPQRVAEGSSGLGGEVAISIDEFGAGWMIERWLVESYRPGYETHESILAFPAQSDRRRLLITLAPGAASPLRPERELMDQYERFR